MSRRLNPMPRCKKCDNLAVNADAGVVTSIPYYYCRTCKIEVDYDGREVKHEPEKDPLEELEEYFEGFDDSDFELDFSGLEDAILKIDGDDR